MTTLNRMMGWLASGRDYEFIDIVKQTSTEELKEIVIDAMVERSKRTLGSAAAGYCAIIAERSANEIRSREKT